MADTPSQAEAGHQDIRQITAGHGQSLSLRPVEQPEQAPIAPAPAFSTERPHGTQPQQAGARQVGANAVSPPAALQNMHLGVPLFAQGATVHTLASQAAAQQQYQLYLRQMVAGNSVSVLPRSGEQHAQAALAPAAVLPCSTYSLHGAQPQQAIPLQVGYETALPGAPFAADRVSGGCGSDDDVVCVSGEAGFPENPAQLAAVGASLGRCAGKGKGKRTLFDIDHVSGDSGLDNVHASGDLQSEASPTRNS